MIRPEHALSVMINKWVRESVPQPHFFTAIDRAQKSSPLTHIHEKARGLVAGFPDTLLVVPGFPMIGIELKTPGNKPTPRQFEVGNAIKDAGGIWGWCDSVEGYYELLRSLNIPLHSFALTYAIGHDATLAGAAIKRSEAKTGKVSNRRYVPKPAAAQIKKTEALRAKVRF